MIAAFIPLIGIVLAAGLAATLGFQSYSRQKEVDRRNDLKKMRMDDYKRLLEAYIDSIPTTANPVSHAPSEQLKAQLNLFVVASDEVLRCAGDLHNYLTTYQSPGSRDTAHIKALFTAMFRAMREDCFEATDLSDAEIIRLSPIS